MEVVARQGEGGRTAASATDLMGPLTAAAADIAMQVSAKMLKEDLDGLMGGALLSVVHSNTDLWRGEEAEEERAALEDSEAAVGAAVILPEVAAEAVPL